MNRSQSVGLAVAAAAWTWVTWQAPSWPVLWVVAGVVLAGVVAVGVYGGDTAGIPAAVAVGWSAVVTGGWAVVNAVWDPPAVWLWRAVAATAVVWGVCVLAHQRTRSVSRSGRRRVAPALRDALAATGIRGLALPGDGEADPVVVSRPRRVGDGDEYRVQLPAGVTASQLVGKEASIAGPLKRHARDLIVVDGDHAAEAVVWVGDPGAGARQAGAWPGFDASRDRSCLAPISVGKDLTGRDVTVMMHGGSGVLIGAMPGQGKSALMNLLLVSILADSRASGYFLDFKGGGDFQAWRPVASGFYTGAPSENPREVLEILGSVVEELNTRTGRLREFKTSKITEDIADEPGMGPVVLVVDEAHELLGQKSAMNPEDRDRAVKLLSSIIARGRAVNVWVLIASQRVTDDEIPASITQRCTVRVAFKLGSQPASQAVLGPDAWAQGHKATQCPAPGVGFLADDQGVRVLRAWHVSDAEAYEIAEDITADRRARVEPDTGPPTPVWSAEDAELLASMGARLPAAQLTAADVSRERIDAQQRAQQEAILAGLREAEEAEIAARAAAARAVSGGAAAVDVEGVREALRGAWPRGQRGPAAEATLVQLAEGSGWGVDELGGVLGVLGAPVVSVRVRMVDGSRPRRAGLTLEGFEGWAGRGL